MKLVAQPSSPIPEQRNDIPRPPRAPDPTDSELHERDDRIDVRLPSLPEASPPEPPSIISRAVRYVPSFDECNALERRRDAV